MRLTPCTDSFGFWWDRDLGEASLSYGAPDSGADIELPTLEGLDPASAHPNSAAVDAEALRRVAAGQRMRRRLSVEMADALGALDQAIGDDLSSGLRDELARVAHAPTESRREDLREALVYLELHATFMSAGSHRRALRSIMGQARALAAPAARHEGAIERILSTLGALLGEFRLVAGQHHLAPVLTLAEVRSRPLADADFKAALEGAEEVLHQALEGHCVLSDKGFELAGLLVGLLRLLPAPGELR